MKALKMAVVFGECGRECLSGPGNTVAFPKDAASTVAGMCVGGGEGGESRCYIILYRG